MSGAAILVLVLAAATPPSADVAPRDLAAAVAAAPTGLWPGFDPGLHPLALYDGEHTWLLRHPTPPEGFEPVDGAGTTWRMEGRHPKLVANTSVDLNGVATATLRLDTSSDRPLDELAALAVHELFHVHQRRAMPGIEADEAHLFDYPVADADLLVLRRLESVCLYRAASAPHPEQGDPWLATALELRRRRFDRMRPEHIRYEQAQELNEGLARYIEDRTSGRAVESRFPEAGWWPPEAVRTRTYTTGQVWALALDRHLPGWKEMVAAGMMPSLDVPLAATLAARGIDPRPVEGADHAAVAAAARTDADRYHERLASLRAAFEATPGWTLRVQVEEGAPLLAPQGFDPLNVIVLGDGLVLHQRMVRLGNARGRVEVLDAESTTFGPGKHPLFNGVRTLEVAGLEDAPRLDAENGRVSLRQPGVELELEGATVTRDPQAEVVVVRLTAEPDTG